MFRKVTLHEILSSGPLEGALNSQASSIKNKSIAVDLYQRTVYPWNNSSAVLLENGSLSLYELDNGLRTELVPSHSSKLKGIKRVADGKFITWSIDGLVIVWEADGNKVLDYKVAIRDDGEVSTAFLDSDMTLLIIGNNFGEIQVIDLVNRVPVQSLVAHGSTVVGIELIRDWNNGSELLVTCSRDRTIQCFTRNNGEYGLMQTLVAHKSNILGVIISGNGERIISYSADRTIHIYKLTTNEESNAYISEKVIFLKSAPSHVVLDSLTGNLVVSSDKNIYIYKVPAGEVANSYRSFDENGESLNISTLVLATFNNKRHIVGMCSDKTCRIYEYSSTSLICVAQQSGHSEGISGLVLLENSNTIASTGNEGSIFLWGINQTNDVEPLPILNSTPSLQVRTSTLQNSPSPNSSPRTPLRKIISKAELNKFQQLAVNKQNTPSPLSISPINSSASQPLLKSPNRRLTVGATNVNATARPRRVITPSKSLSELNSHRYRMMKIGLIPERAWLTWFLLGRMDI